MSSDEANSSPTDVADFEKAKAQIHAKHGDIVLECVGLLSQDNHTAHTYAFDVHIQRMAACSGFFEDMLEASHPGETDVKGQDLQTPIVRMEEDWRVVLVLIAWAYNKREILKLLPSQTSWSDLLDVYKASHKYSFHTLAPYVSILLRSKVEDIDCDNALKVYSRAWLFDDRDLAKAMLPKAVQVPMIHIPYNVLDELTTRGLAELISSHNTRTRGLIDTVDLALWGKACLDAKGRLVPLAKLYPRE